VAPDYAGPLKTEHRLCIGEEGSLEQGNLVKFYLAVKEEDGLIVEARFQAFGETLLIGAAEILCELALGKNYAQAKRFSADLVINKGFPEDSASYINLAIDALDLALAQCEGLPMPEEFLVTPVDFSDLKKGEYPNWDALSHNERIAIIQEILAHEITPYVQLDGGNVIIKELKDPLILIIKYEGNCTSCISSTGSTLNAIQQILRARVHPELQVVPEL
jgi:NifU-like protein